MTCAEPAGVSSWMLAPPGVSVCGRGAEVAEADAVSANLRPGFACRFNEFGRPLVVRIQYSDAGCGIDGAVEEKALRGEVLVHRLVVVEMVAREIGKDGDVKRNAISAALVERVARDLGDQFAGAATGTLGHQFEQIARLGRGVERGTHFAGKVVFDGADQNRLASSSVEQRFGEKGRRRLSVCSGDAGGGHLALGMPEEGSGSFSEGAATMLDFRQRDVGVVDDEVIEGRR